MAEEQLKQGDVVGGDFEILRALGSGGMGSVYLARQRSTEKVRAFKVMHSRLSAEASFVERFEREARIGSRIRSQHIVQVVAAGIDPDRALPWLAMEYLEGCNLSDAMAVFGPPGSADAQRLTGELWHAVCAAHDARIVHRDLKPDNLFIARTHSPGRHIELKVLDFGIAKWLSPNHDKGTIRVLTHGWGAPEQAIPGMPIGPQADVWAMGLITFWLWSGSVFWLAPDDFDGLQLQVFRRPIPKASERAKELGCECTLPPEFDAWFARCVAREQEHRFADANAAFQAWQSVTLPSSVRAQPWRLDKLSPLAATEPVSSSNESPVEREMDATPHVTGPMQRFGAPTPGKQTSAPLAVTNARLIGATEFTHSLALRLNARTLAVSVVIVGLVGIAGMAMWQRVPVDVTPAAQKVNDAAEPLVSPQQARFGMQPVSRGQYVFGKGATSGIVTPTHITLTRAFLMDVQEVSVRDYDECVRQERCAPAKLITSGSGASLGSTYDVLCNSGHKDRAQHPINCVSRVQAQKYCAYRGKRLPTEAEWEFAARGTDERLYPWGNSAPSACDDAVVDGLCRRQRQDAPTLPVASRAARSNGPFGHADLAGNVWEWVADDWESDPFSGRATSDPAVHIGQGLGVVRGGAWDHPATFATTTSRRSFEVEHSDVNIGFRCVVDQAGAQP